MVRQRTREREGSVTQTTRRVEETQRSSSHATAAMGIVWIVDSAVGTTRVLRAPRSRIGRSAECEIRIDHPSVSRHHAEISREGETYTLRDFESTNGTSLNGARVEHARLSPGDVLRVGDCIGIALNVTSGGDCRDFGTLAPGLFGGPTTAAALRDAKQAAPSDVPIVIVGETGTGKERIARAIHHWSGRTGPFVAVNCSTVPAPLAEAELFGHQRGAFTGAERAREGLFQTASNGTLFLDEIPDLPLAVQAKLLRAVELGEVMPLGGTAGTKLNVRVLAASQESLETLVQAQRFRPDLAARLAGFVVEAPPLRERRDEIAALFLHFVEAHAKEKKPRVGPALLEWLCLREWPGNVRELELMARKLLALHGAEPELRLAHAEALTEGPRSSKAPAADAAASTRIGFRDRREDDLHRLRRALEQTKGNLTAAAASIGISRRRAYRLLESDKSEPSEN